MLTTTDALIIRSQDSGDHDKILTVLSAEEGRMTVMVKGGRSIHSNQLAICQPYSYVNMELYKKGNMYWLRSGSVNQYFHNLTNDLETLYIAAYLCDIAYDASDEGTPANELLRLLLNALYAMDQKIRPSDIVKAAFEWKVAVQEGYAPGLDSCSVCGKHQDEVMYLDVMNGSLICGSCMQARASIRPQLAEMNGERYVLCTLHPFTLEVLRYIEQAPTKRFLSFKDPDILTDELCSVCETYLLNHLERSFDSLESLKSIRKLLPMKPVQLHEEK